MIDKNMLSEELEVNVLSLLVLLGSAFAAGKIKGATFEEFAVCYQDDIHKYIGETLLLFQKNGVVYKDENNSN